jgi:DNA-binding NarL/FixJ family response regulator
MRAPVQNRLHGAIMFGGPAVDKGNPQIAECAPTVPPPGSCLAVDNHALARNALRCLIEATWTHAVVSEAASGETAVGIVSEEQPDLVLMDVRMPGLGGIDAARQIKRINPSTVVLLVSSAHPDELPRRADEFHADAVFPKSQLRPKLLDEVWARLVERARPVR